MWQIKISYYVCLWKFSEMGAGTEKGQFGLEIQSDIFYDQTDRLQ